MFRRIPGAVSGSVALVDPSARVPPSALRDLGFLLVGQGKCACLDQLVHCRQLAYTLIDLHTGDRYRGCDDPAPSAGKLARLRCGLCHHIKVSVHPGPPDLRISF